MRSTVEETATRAMLGNAPSVLRRLRDAIHVPPPSLLRSFGGLVRKPTEAFWRRWAIPLRSMEEETQCPAF